MYNTYFERIPEDLTITVNLYIQSSHSQGFVFFNRIFQSYIWLPDIILREEIVFESTVIRRGSF